jgi:hypothetical protein
MKRFQLALGALLLLTACDRDSITNSDTVPATPGGGTYGSGGNRMVGDGPRFDGGGTYGSGGFVAGGQDSVVTTNATTLICDPERGGGTYGSGGKSDQCVTGPTL